MSLPLPPLSFVNELDKLLYSFLWYEKPDRINRKQVNQGYLQGGLNMINIHYFIKALQSTWIRRLLKVS